MHFYQTGLAAYFFDGYMFRREVIAATIAKLEVLLRWFKAQNRLVNYFDVIFVSNQFVSAISFIARPF